MHEFSSPLIQLTSDGFGSRAGQRIKPENSYGNEERDELDGDEHRSHPFEFSPCRRHNGIDVSGNPLECSRKKKRAELGRKEFQTPK